MQEYDEKYLSIVSKNIKKFRQAKGMSQEELAEKVDCSREFINKVENRKEDISFKMLLKLSLALEVIPQNLFEDS